MGVVMEHGDSSVLCGGSGDERIRDRHAVVSVVAFGQLADSAHRGIGDGAIAAQNPQRIEISLKLDVLGAAARGVEDLHAHDWRDPRPIVVSRRPDECRQIPAERREPPPRRGVYDERRVATQELDGIYCWLGVFAGQLLDVLERVAIQTIRAEDTLHQPPYTPGPLIIA